MREIKTILTVSVIALFFTACGGSSSGDSAPPANQEVADPVQLEHAPADDPANDQLGAVDNLVLEDGYRVTTSGNQLGRVVFEFCGDGYTMSSSAGGFWGNFSVTWGVEILLDEFNNGNLDYVFNTSNMALHSILVGETYDLISLANNETIDTLLVESIDKIECP